MWGLSPILFTRLPLASFNWNDTGEDIVKRTRCCQLTSTDRVGVFLASTRSTKTYCSSGLNTVQDWLKDLALEHAVIASTSENCVEEMSYNLHYAWYNIYYIFTLCRFVVSNYFVLLRFTQPTVTDFLGFCFIFIVVADVAVSGIYLFCLGHFCECLLYCLITLACYEWL